MDLLGIITAISSLGAGLCLLAYRLIRLRFFRHVYDTGGAKDVAVIANAMKWELPYPGGRGAGDPPAGAVLEREAPAQGEDAGGQP